MSDLISRKVVMDWLRDLQARAIINSHNGTLVDATIVAAVNNFIDFVVQVPTAFDEDKVVEKLENLIVNNKSVDKTQCETIECLSADCIECMLLYAINIVKGTVKDE